MTMLSGVKLTMYRPKTEVDRRRILARTHNRCHLCSKTLCINNYGKLVGRGAWEVDHSLPQANGGTHHGNNLLAACVRCNRSKGAGSSRIYRKSNDLTIKPTSTAKRKRNQLWNSITGGTIGAICGLRFGPIGAIYGGIVGAAIGNETNPD